MRSPCVVLAGAVVLVGLAVVEKDPSERIQFGMSERDVETVLGGQVDFQGPMPSGGKLRVWNCGGGAVVGHGGRGSGLDRSGGRIVSPS